MQVYDRVLSTGGLTTLALLSLITVLALGVQSLLDWVRSRLLVRAGAHLDMNFSMEVVWAALSRTGGDEGRGRAMRDFDTLRQALSGPVLLSILDAPWGILYLGLTYMLHPLLGVLATVVSVAMLAVAFINEHRTRAPLKAAGEAAAQGYATLEAASRSVNVVGALGMKRAMVVKHIVERAEMIRRQADGNFRGAAYSSFNKTLRIVVQSAAVGLGAWLVVKGSMSGGALMAASFLLGRALSPIEQITGAWPTLDKARSSYRSLKALFANAPADADQTRLPAPKGKITFENVTVNAPGGARPVLRDLTFTLEPGFITGVAGASGSGKSTMARAIVGCADVAEGVVRVDGAALSDWDSERLGRHIGFVPQEFTLFQGTVKQNISRFAGYLGADPERLDEMVIAAATTVGAHDMILSLPKGYDTMLGPQGGGLSGGQTQRIALARAFFGNPAIMVLDEPNAHLDGLAEQNLIEALKAARSRGAAVILMAHSRALLGIADRMIVLKDGEVDLSGSLTEVAALMRERRSGPRAAPATETSSPGEVAVPTVARAAA